MASTKKDLKLRIKSVKSTQKITKAMKMVAAAKLRRAKSRLEESLPYAQKLRNLVNNFSSNLTEKQDLPPLLVGRADNKHLLIVATSDRGLCGSFNSSITKLAKKNILEMENAGKEVIILCIGRKGYEQMKPYYPEEKISKIEGLHSKQVVYADAITIAEHLLGNFAAGKFGSCSIIYNKFKNAISQITTSLQLIPFQIEETATVASEYEFEPNQSAILEDLLPHNLAIQIYQVLLDNAASEQGARMTAMDNATSSAGEMIKNLSLMYNRTRQSAITTELIEIIAGAESM
jgi:F-type H+-transporting ATPase subunit gamma